MFCLEPDHPHPGLDEAHGVDWLLCRLGVDDDREAPQILPVGEQPDRRLDDLGGLDQAPGADPTAGELAPIRPDGADRSPHGPHTA